MKQTDNMTTSIYIPRKLKIELTALAQLEHRRFNGLVIIILADYVRRLSKTRRAK